MCRMGFFASASGLNSCSYIVLEPFCLFDNPDIWTKTLHRSNLQIK